TGNVFPNNLSTLAWFEWGTSTNYGTLTVSTNVGSGSGTTGVAVATGLVSLIPGTAYHFHLVATNNTGVAFGADQSFVTVSTNAPLPGLTSTVGPFAPAFDPSVTNYAAFVFNSIGTMTVTPTATDPTASIQVRINGGAFTSVVSGAASGFMPLQVGTNAI